MSRIIYSTLYAFNLPSPAGGRDRRLFRSMLSETPLRMVVWCGLEHWQLIYPRRLPCRLWDIWQCGKTQGKLVLITTLIKFTTFVIPQTHACGGFGFDRPRCLGNYQYLMGRSNDSAKWGSRRVIRLRTTYTAVPDAPSTSRSRRRLGAVWSQRRNTDAFFQGNSQSPDWADIRPGADRGGIFIKMWIQVFESDLSGAFGAWTL